MPSLKTYVLVPFLLLSCTGCLPTSSQSSASSGSPTSLPSPASNDRIGRLEALQVQLVERYDAGRSWRATPMSITLRGQDAERLLSWFSGPNRKEPQRADMASDARFEILGVKDQRISISVDLAHWTDGEMIYRLAPGAVYELLTQAENMTATPSLAHKAPQVTAVRIIEYFDEAHNATGGPLETSLSGSRAAEFAAQFPELGLKKWNNELKLFGGLRLYLIFTTSDGDQLSVCVDPLYRYWWTDYGRWSLSKSAAIELMDLTKYIAKPVK